MSLPLKRSEEPLNRTEEPRDPHDYGRLGPAQAPCISDMRSGSQASSIRARRDACSHSNGIDREYFIVLRSTNSTILRNRWNTVQTGFVDQPRRAVEQADELVASAMQRLAEVFAEERSKLEKQWDRGDNVSTEDLRVALQHYRSFFHRLLSVQER